MMGSMDTLTICMFSNLYPPVVSGSSTQTVSLARQLAGRGHKVIVITAQVDTSLPEFVEHDGVYVYRLKAFVLPKLRIALNFPWLNFTFGLANLRRVTEILKEHQPDILHLHNHMFDLGLIATRMRRRFRIPLVTTIHTIIRHSNPLYNLFLIPADRVVLKRMIIDQSDQVICPDFNVARYVNDAFGRSEYVIIPYGINPLSEHDPAQVEFLCEKHGIQNKKVILSLGHVHEIRNRHDLIAALPEVLEHVPDTVLLIVGAISTQSPQKLAESLGAEDAVIFAGPVPYESIANYLAMADLEAHWLNQEEPERTSLGIASLEAMLAGKTVLAAANPDTYGPNLLKNGENIIIVPTGEPTKLAQIIIELLDNENLRAKIGLNAQNSVAKHFSWHAITEQTLHAYALVMDRHQMEK